MARLGFVPGGLFVALSRHQQRQRGLYNSVHADAGHAAVVGGADGLLAWAAVHFDAEELANGGWNTNGDPNNPINPCRFGARSYNYFSWAIPENLWLADPESANSDVWNTPTLATLISNLDPLFLTGLQFDIVPGMENNDPEAWEKDIEVTEGTIYRLREGIERFFITGINNPAASAKAQSETWIYQDDVNWSNPQFQNHIPGGGNVLYMDGHVAFVRYPGETPFSKAWAVLLGIIADEISPPTP